MLLASFCLFALASCTSSQSPVRPVEAKLDRGWPKPATAWHETPSQVVPVGWNGENRFWKPADCAPVQASLPGVPGAVPVQNDEFCGSCHKTYTQSFASTAHREIGCEKCHGAASVHLETRGTLGNSILSFATPEQGTRVGLLLSPAERSEVCLQCHEQPQESRIVPCLQGWRTSAHANKGVTCTDCHRAHYNVPLGTPTVDETAQTGPHSQAVPASWERPQPALGQELPAHAKNRLAAVSSDVCYRCHEDLRRFEDVVHPHQLGVPFDFSCTACHDPPPRGAPQQIDRHPTQFECTTCHDSHGNVRAETRKELCLTCHTGPHMEEWYGAPHDAAGVACTDCHNPHPQQGLPMAVNQPETCYRCHAEMRQLEQIAHPHQILGPQGFNCNTCHRPHGKVQAETRKDLCLKCHDGAPTMAWHSSIHEQYGVACADCHNAHPETKVPQTVHLIHTNVDRPKRLPMSVDEPQACYQCHPKIYGLTNLPSHHPIREGKLLCSDCHDSHGQAKGNLKEESVNAQCYECHAEKEGPFVYEHPPVTENCAHCHEPHGTVANDLLRQPVTFLCLRCHAGHSSHGRSSNCQRCHSMDGEPTNVGGGPLDPMIPTNSTIRGAMYTDCTQCHTQVHGSDLPEGMVSAHKGLR